MRDFGHYWYYVTIADRNDTPGLRAMRLRYTDFINLSDKINFYQSNHPDTQCTTDSFMSKFRKKIIICREYPLLKWNVFVNCSIFNDWIFLCYPMKCILNFCRFSLLLIFFHCPSLFFNVIYFINAWNPWKVDHRFFFKIEII